MTDLYNKRHDLEIAIIGAGLSGLYLAHLLVAQRGVDWAENCLRVYEARPRCGGRILGLELDHPVNNNYQLDLGPSWLWPDDQPAMATLAAKFKLPLLQQWQQGYALFQSDRDAAPRSYCDYHAYAGACRIKGGAQHLVQALLNTLPDGVIQTQHTLQSLQDKDNHIDLQFLREASSTTNTNMLNCSAQHVVLTLPPRLIAHSIQFEPDLQTPLRKVMEATPTWMAGHAKVAIHYEQAFWRRDGFSGAVLANYPGAVLAEVFDTCGPQAEPAALGAFMALSPAIRQQWQDDLPALIIDQLVTLFGREAAAPIKLEIQDWQQQAFTATAEDSQPLYEHPQYGHPWLQLDHWNDKLFYSGTETSPKAGGYMEGALLAAQRVFASLNTSVPQPR